MHVRKAFAILLLCMAAISGTAWCQATTGSIRGVVTDGDGQPVPGATITIYSKALIGGSRTSTTNTSGVFRFPSLPIGLYSAGAELKGFERVHANNIEVRLGVTASVLLEMKLSRTEAVTVSGETPLIDLQNAGTPTIFKPEMVEGIPMTRRMWVLMQVAPGVTTDYGDNLSPATIAFGSNRQSNSWRIDGIDVTGPETGMAWWETNPDIIDQIQVYGVGAPAEYGNHMGAVLNVVTKRGSNSLHGAFNSFFQTDALTGVNVRLPDSEFVFHRDRYHDLTVQIGGPILKDRVWFFGAAQTSRDASTPPGIPPEDATLDKNDRYDFKVTTRLAKNHELNGFFHHEEFDLVYAPIPNISASALPKEFGSNPAWGATLTSTLNPNFLLEIGYAGWWSSDLYTSQTGSMENPFFDDTVEPVIVSGSVAGPWDYATYRHQINGKATYYAENFLRAQHDFKFGVQYSYGSADTIFALGPYGAYNRIFYWGTYYHFEQAPFHYGGVSQNLGIFVDDNVAIGSRFTLNAGLRFDHNLGSIPDYDRLEVGSPSISEIGNFRPSGVTVPGVKNYIDWKLISPRLGFVWSIHNDGRAALRGSFGIYYDHDAMGNWDMPPPSVPPTITYIRNPDTGQLDFAWESFPQEQFRENKLNPPRTVQYSIGYEHQPTQNSSLGLQYVYKDTDNLIGWEIIGGNCWTPKLFTDPFTGHQYTLLGLDFNAPFPTLPTLQKGNNPGDFPGSDGLRYFQKYHGILLTFSKRFSDNWALNASYTWSKSYGLIPRPLSQIQFVPFYSSAEGTDPNNYINAEGRLQGDRPHMLRAQLVFFKLPWDLQAATSVELSSGRPYARQIRVRVPGGFSTVIMEPAGSLRHSPIQNIDLSIGKRFSLGNRLQLEVDAEILNLLNSDQELEFATLILRDPSQDFVPIAWVQPRRLQLQMRLQF